MRRLKLVQPTPCVFDCCPVVLPCVQCCTAQYRALYCRYYSVGPATIHFVDEGADEEGDGSTSPSAGSTTAVQQNDKKSGKGNAQRSQVQDTVLPYGASWTWQYPYHYAPLMCDLSSSSATAYRPSAARTAALYCPPLRIVRVLQKPLTAPVQAWAPPGGPVRPLLQLMSVLPPRRFVLPLGMFVLPVQRWFPVGWTRRLECLKLWGLSDTVHLGCCRAGEFHVPPLTDCTLLCTCTSLVLRIMYCS